MHSHLAPLLRTTLLTLSRFKAVVPLSIFDLIRLGCTITQQVSVVVVVAVRFI